MTNFKGTVILDADDVLVDLKYSLCATLNKYTGKDISCEEWGSFNITEIYDNLHIQEFYDLITENHLLRNADPIDNARSTLIKIRELGYRIVIISARAYHPDAHAVTVDWFKRKEIPFDAVHISGGGIRKSYYANIYDDIVASADDNLDNCIDFKEKCNIKNVLLVTQPWNVSDTSFQRIANISELLNYL